MTFWAIAYTQQPDIFYNVHYSTETPILSTQCLLPSVLLAEQIIEDELDSTFVPVEITIATLNHSGTFTWYRNLVDAWDGRAD